MNLAINLLEAIADELYETAEARGVLTPVGEAMIDAADALYGLVEQIVKNGD